MFDVIHCEISIHITLSVIFERAEYDTVKCVLQLRRVKNPQQVSHKYLLSAHVRQQKTDIEIVSSKVFK